jgi:tRNA U34 5-carboxymethylaminomethyl modifying GTPase MnmE/TrmE
MCGWPPGAVAITGRIDPEDVLGRVFSTFCIGK